MVDYPPSPFLTVERLSEEMLRMSDVDDDGCSTWRGFKRGWSPRGLLYQVDQEGAKFWPSVCGTPHPIPHLFGLAGWQGEPDVTMHAILTELELTEPVSLLNP